MDGFHHYNSWLERINCAPSKAHQRHSTLRNWRKSVPGCGRGLYVAAVRSTKHDPVEDALDVTAPLVIVEGNGCCWTTRSGASLRNFVISRFYQSSRICVAGASGGAQAGGGLSLADAEAFYDRTDGPNVRGCWKKVCLQI